MESSVVMVHGDRRDGEREAGCEGGGSPGKGKGKVER